MVWFPLPEPSSSKVSLGGGEHSQGQWLRRDFLNQAPFWDTSPGRDRRAQLPGGLTITLWFLSPSILLLSALSLAGRGGHGKALFVLFCWSLNIGPFLSVLDLVEEFQLWIHCAIHTKTYLTTTKSCSGKDLGCETKSFLSQNHFCCSWPLPYWSWRIPFSRRMTKSSIQSRCSFGFLKQILEDHCIDLSF